MSAVDDILASRVISPASEITSWLDGAPLGVVPLSQGQVVETASGDSLARLEFTLPATKEWMPRDPRHPLAPFGQELLVRRGFRVYDDSIGWEVLGRFRIRTTEPTGDGWLTVVADSIDVRLTMARWIVDTTTTGTLANQAKQICSGIVPINIAMPDRASSNRVWDDQENRRDALLELCDSWGAVLRMIDGALTIVPRPVSTTPSITVTSGDGGTLVSAVPERLADPVPNIVVASNTPQEGEPTITAMAIIPAGPRAWDGPYGQVVQFYASPVITTNAQAAQAATTLLSRLQAKAPDVTVEAVTDPRIRLDTVVRVVDAPTDTDVDVRVVEVRHALTRGKEPGGFLGTYLRGDVEGPPMAPEAPASRPRRVALRPTWSGTWRAGWARNTSKLVQGRRPGTTGPISFGVAYYGRLPNNIVSGTVRLARDSGGDPGAVVPTVRLFQGTAWDPGSPGTVAASVSGPPIGPSSTVEWDLPASWITQMNAGTAGGIGIGPGSGSPYLVLTASGLGMTLALTLTE